MGSDSVENESSQIRVDDADRLLLFFDRQPSTSSRPSQGGSPVVTAQLSGTFLHDSASPDWVPHILCYRRNLFQIRGTIDFHGASVGSVLKSSRSGGPLELRIALAARENFKNENVAIITVPKSTKEGASTNSTAAPAPIICRIDPHSQSQWPFAFSWPRLQFRTATAKGGRRKDKSFDQYFTINIAVSALLADSTEILISDKVSAPIIVRGRSPSNFSSVGKQNIQAAETSVLTTETPNLESTSEAHQPWEYAEMIASKMPSYFSGTDLLISRDDTSAFDGMTSLAIDANDDIEALGHPGLLNPPFHVSDDLISVPLGTNLDDSEAFHLTLDHVLQGDEFTRSSPQSKTTVETLAQPTRLNNSGNTANTDQTQSPLSGEYFRYKYIPLSMDDRTLPVQAVYQPHGAHHKVTLPKTRQGNNKRYFGEFSD